jgi:hypothetical protein
MIANSLLASGTNHDLWMSGIIFIAVGLGAVITAAWVLAKLTAKNPSPIRFIAAGGLVLLLIGGVVSAALGVIYAGCAWIVGAS